MVGGNFTSFVPELVVNPAIYETWKWYFELNRGRAKPQPRALAALLSPEGDAMTTCPASESGACRHTLRVFTHTQQREPRIQRRALHTPVRSE